MFALNRVVAIEARGERINLVDAVDTEEVERGSPVRAHLRVAVLLLLVVVGILARWFWEAGWEFLRGPANEFPWEGWPRFLVRLGLSFIAATLTFVSTYTKVNQNTSESWVPFVLSFQNGFFWESLFDAVVQDYGGSPSPAPSTPTSIP